MMKEIVIIGVFLLALAVFFFPLIISIITGNYWLFFLFFVSWIPALIILLLLGAGLKD